MRTCFFSTT